MEVGHGPSLECGHNEVPDDHRGDLEEVNADPQARTHHDRLRLIQRLGGCDRALFVFTLKWVSANIADDRYQMCGREDQESKGFILWRNFRIPFSGGSSNIVKCGGFRNFIRHPKCEDDRRCQTHSADWKKVLTQYGGSMRNDAKSLRARSWRSSKNNGGKAHAEV